MPKISKKSIFGGVFGLVLVVGIIVGVLFATGVLGKQSSGGSSSTPIIPIIPGKTPISPTSYCGQMPTVQSVTPIGDYTFRVSFTPINDPCTQLQSWTYWYSMTIPNGETSQTGTMFRPTSGQTFLDIQLGSPTDSGSTGYVWLQAVNSDGTGNLMNSNKVPYVIS